MLRAEMPARLDAAVAQSRVTLVHGLPRVGRSALVRRWARGRTDVSLRPSHRDGDNVAPIVVFDHMAVEDVGLFVRQFRAAEQIEERTRFVVVPTDLAAAERLRAALTGSIYTFDVWPLQLDDVCAEVPVLAMANGPVQGLVPSPTASNAPVFDPERHWLRGGLPESLAADADEISLAWRRGMLEALLGRDYSGWDVPRASRLPEILRWVANQNGGELDDNACPVAKRADLRSALHVLEKLGIIRRLPNFPAGSSSSLGKKQKVFVRDSGILHAILGIETSKQLRDHASVGESWESYSIEALIAASAEKCRAQFYRASGSDGEDEIDLVLDFVPFCGRLVAVECKLSPRRSARAGFHRACAAIDATDRLVIHSGIATVLEDRVHRVDLSTALRRISQIATGRYRPA